MMKAGWNKRNFVKVATKSTRCYTHTSCALHISPMKRASGIVLVARFAFFGRVVYDPGPSRNFSCSDDAVDMPASCPCDAPSCQGSVSDQTG